MPAEGQTTDKTGLVHIGHGGLRPCPQRPVGRSLGAGHTARHHNGPRRAPAASAPQRTLDQTGTTPGGPEQQDLESGGDHSGPERQDHEARCNHSRSEG